MEPQYLQVCAHYDFLVRLALVPHLSWLAFEGWQDFHICPSTHQQWVFHCLPYHTSQGTSWSIKAIDGSKLSTTIMMMVIPLFLFVMSYESLILWGVNGYESQWQFCNVRYFSFYFWILAIQHAPWRCRLSCMLWCSAYKKHWCGIESYGRFFYQKRLFQCSLIEQRQSPESLIWWVSGIETVDYNF